MSKYLLHNRAQGTIEVNLPASFTKSGSHIHILIPMSMAKDLGVYLNDPSTLSNVPRVKYLVNNNLAEVVIE